MQRAARGIAREREQIGDDGGGFERTARDRFEGGSRLLRRTRASGLRDRRDRGQRRAQFVCRIGGEDTLAFARGFERRNSRARQYVRSDGDDCDDRKSSAASVMATRRIAAASACEPSGVPSAGASIDAYSRAINA